ncbi:hypothetical protein C808_00094 [Lachnospiraceae bacterium M18-1]|nr:hypothetical protein C808_00094 [Lachnospiraceae bacterium M18-1]
MNVLTNGATIEVEGTGERFHTMKDWGMAISNNNYIGDVVHESRYVDVPGADGFLDFSEAIAGRRIFKERTINIEIGGKKPRNDWDSIISDIRNKIEGKKVRIIFDNDTGFYWTGRATIKEFDRNREIGTFTLSIPKADPYKYKTEESTDDWLWDDLDFETGIIDEDTTILLTESNNTQSYTIIAGGAPFVPEIQVSYIGETGISMTAYGDNYTLLKGKNRFADIVIDQEDVTLEFSGIGEIIIKFRRKSM